MSNLSKMFIAVIVLVVLFGGFRYLRNNSSSSTDNTGTYDNTVTTDNSSVSTPPAATGSIDDAVAAFNQEQLEEASLTDTGVQDKTLVMSDSQIINDTTKIYDENQL